MARWDENDQHKQFRKHFAKIQRGRAGLKIKSILFIIYVLDQAPQTRGPRATCGPREGSMRPSNNSFSKKETMSLIFNDILSDFLQNHDF
jgi:hypothetical protein